jgi:hypothetical protein
MRQKLIDAHNNKKKLAEERNIEEDILLKRIKERATKKTIAREIKKKVKQLEIIDSDTENIIDEVIRNPKYESEDEPITPIKPKSKVKTTKKPVKPTGQPIHVYPPYKQEMTINFV